MHWRNDCPFAEAECHLCGRVGHMKKMCFFKNNSNFPKNSNNSKSFKKNSHKTNYQNTGDSSTSNEYIFTSNSMNSNEPCIHKVRLNNVLTICQ